MNLINVSEMIDQPLAGCNRIIQDENNFEILQTRLLLHLSLYTSSSFAYMIFDLIMSEHIEGDSGPVTTFNEYVINELQYEMRKASKKFDAVQESDLLNQWVKIICEKHSSDDALDFVNYLKRNRELRYILS